MPSQKSTVLSSSLSESTVNELLLQGAGIGTWIWNIQTGEIRINEKWAEIIGYTLEELCPTSIETWQRLTHPDDLRASDALLKRHFEGLDAQYSCHARMRHKRGHWVHVLDRGKVLIRNAAGSPLWMFGSHLDVTEQRVAELERHQFNDRFHRLARHLPGFLYQYRLRPDGTSHFPFATASIRDIYGRSPEDVLEDATPVFKVLHPEDAERVASAIAASARTLTTWHDRYRVLHPMRGLIWVDGNATPEQAEDGSITWHGYLRDVTQLQLQSERLELAAKVFSSSQEGIVITDAGNRIIDVNEAFTLITGYERHEVIGKSPAILSSGRQGAGFYKRMWASIANTGRWRGEIWNRRKNGEVYAEMLSVDTIKRSDGTVQNYIAVFSDISQIKEHQEELVRIAHYDVLTGLPNRRILDDRLHVAIEKAKRDKQLAAVCFLDLDGFKAINDSFGHEAGDQLLIDLAADIRHAVRAHDTVSRFGGDEFVLLLTEMNSRNQIVEVVDRVLQVCHRQVTQGNASLPVSASVGIAVYPELEIAPDVLLRFADQAMYRAKQQGRNRYVFFDSHEDHAIRKLHDRLLRIEAALQQGELLLHFQPKVDLRSGLACSVEALLRWRQADGSILPAGAFIQDVVDHPLEIQLGRWVLNRALEHHQAWVAQGIALPVSINISADHLLEPAFVQELADALKRNRIADPAMVDLEILETSRIADFALVRRTLLDCKGLGVKFSLDDFGTGYSSLTYMRQLPVEHVKIDQSFVRGMLDDDSDHSIVQGIIGLGHAFDHRVIAEGAETWEHLIALRDMGCDIAQGYGIAKPMPADQIPAWIRDWNRHGLASPAV